MFLRGMSDWNAELEDIDWDVFGRGDDHIVPYQGIEPLAESSTTGDAQKKPRHELKNDVGKNMCGRGSSTKTVLWREEGTCAQNASSSVLEGSRAHPSNLVVPTLSDLESFANSATLPYRDGRILDSCVNRSNSRVQSKTPFSKDHSLGTTVLTNDNKSCLSLLDGVSSDVSNLSFLGNYQKVKTNDLAYYDCPDISNFEDIDKMFRNWDPTFGQGQSGTTDDLSWFSSSSNTIYNLENAFDMGFQSSSPDFGVLPATLESHHPNANFLFKNAPAAADHGKPKSSHYTDLLATPSKTKSAGKEKSFGGQEEINSTGIAQINNDYNLNYNGASNIEMESQESSENKRTKGSADQMLSGSDTLASQIYAPKQFSKEDHFIGSCSPSYITDLNPDFPIEFGLPVHQLPFTQKISSFDTEQGTNPSSSYEVSDDTVNHSIQCTDRLPHLLYMPQATADGEELDKIYQRQKFCAGMTAEHSPQSAFQSKASVQKKLLENRDDAEMDDACLEVPVVERDYPTAQESSGMTSLSSDDISEKVASFRLLQDVMHQLDVRTKLCIRDSLYRLARSARQRHDFTVQNCGEGATVTEGIQVTEASKRSPEFVTAETNTNPIDRSIAHLLFHKPFEPATRPADDTKLSLVS